MREPLLATIGALRRTADLELFRPTRVATWRAAPKWLVGRTAPFLVVARSDSGPGLLFVKRIMSHRARAEVPGRGPEEEDDSEIFHVCPQPGGRVLALRRKPRTTH